MDKREEGSGLKTGGMGELGCGEHRRKTHYYISVLPTVHGQVLETDRWTEGQKASLGGLFSPS